MVAVYSAWPDAGTKEFLMRRAGLGFGPAGQVVVGVHSWDWGE